jgi:nicotinamidase/pyrazinamidase
MTQTDTDTAVSTKDHSDAKASPKAKTKPKQKETTRDTIESILFAFVLAFLALVLFFGVLGLPQARVARVETTLGGEPSPAAEAGIPIVASRDWHPGGHCSFADQGGLWPPHCVQETEGAALHPALSLPPETILISKGTDPYQDQYSAFADPAILQDLKHRGVQRLWIGGLAQDVCVKATALDAIQAGFEVALIPEATAPVTTEGGVAAVQEMRAAGVEI